MDRTQKWMGSVGCLGQIENIKRQSLLYEKWRRPWGRLHFFGSYY